MFNMTSRLFSLFSIVNCLLMLFLNVTSCQGIELNSKDSSPLSSPSPSKFNIFSRILYVQIHISFRYISKILYIGIYVKLVVFDVHLLPALSCIFRTCLLFHVLLLTFSCQISLVIEYISSCPLTYCSFISVPLRLTKLTYSNTSSDVSIEKQQPRQQRRHDKRR